MNFFQKRQLLFLTLWATSLSAHTSILTPIHRANENIKTGPCGASPSAKVEGNYTAGGNLTLSWSNYIKHRGYFRIAIATKPNPANDNDFVVLENPVAPPAVNPYPNFMDPKIHIYNSGDKPNNLWSATVKIPETMSCERCTLQVIEYMMDQGPNTPPTLYHSCSDISVAPKANPNPSPTPTPDPSTGGGAGGGNDQLDPDSCK